MYAIQFSLNDQLASLSPGLALWTSRERTQAFAVGTYASVGQVLYLEGAGASAALGDRAMDWVEVENGTDGDHYVTGHTVMRLQIQPDLDGDADVDANDLALRPGVSGDHGVLYGAASNRFHRVDLRTDGSVPGTYELRLDGPEGAFRVWPNATGTGTPLLSLLPGGTRAATITPISNRALWIECLGPGADTLRYRWRDPDGEPRFGDALAFTGVGVAYDSVVFTSDHGTLVDWATDYVNAPDSPYSPRGWVRGSANNPISHTQGEAVSVEVRICVIPSGLSFTLSGTSDLDALCFQSAPVVSTGMYQVLSLTSSGRLPSRIDTIEKGLTWSVQIQEKPFAIPGESGPHKIYVTWSSVGNGPTLRRVNRSCGIAWGQETVEGIADSIQQELAVTTTCEPSPYWYWGVMQYQKGLCNQQASCMQVVYSMLGAGDAELRLVYASNTPGAGNCLSIDSRQLDGRTWYLLLDFDTGPGYAWNHFEGCCFAAGHYYAIEPKRKAVDDYQMLLALPCQQYWVLTENDIDPMDGIPYTIEAIEELPKP